MGRSERGIVFTNDLDGVHFRAPLPIKTAIRIARRFPLPESGAKIGEYSPHGIKEVTLSRISIFMHSRRPVNRGGLEGLGLFKDAAERNQRDLKFAALSGRESDKHKMTVDRLRKSGHMDYFTDLFLNQGARGIPWKEFVIRGLLEEGQKVVHIDDDPRAGICVARIDAENVLVYLLRNLSNHPRLLKRFMGELPPNLVLVQNFRKASEDFDKRLSEGKF